MRTVLPVLVLAGRVTSKEYQLGRLALRNLVSILSGTYRCLCEESVLLAFLGK